MSSSSPHHRHNAIHTLIQVDRQPPTPHTRHPSTHSFNHPTAVAHGILIIISSTFGHSHRRTTPFTLESAPTIWCTPWGDRVASVGSASAPRPSCSARTQWRRPPWTPKIALVSPQSHSNTDSRSRELVASLPPRSWPGTTGWRFPGCDTSGGRCSPPAATSLCSSGSDRTNRSARRRTLRSPWFCGICRGCCRASLLPRPAGLPAVPGDKSSRLQFRPSGGRWLWRRTQN